MIRELEQVYFLCLSEPQQSSPAAAPRWRGGDATRLDLKPHTPHAHACRQYRIVPFTITSRPAPPSHLLGSAARGAAPPSGRAAVAGRGELHHVGARWAIAVRLHLNFVGQRWAGGGTITSWRSLEFYIDDGANSVRHLALRLQSNIADSVNANAVLWMGRPNPTLSLSPIGWLLSLLSTATADPTRGLVKLPHKNQKAPSTRDFRAFCYYIS